MKIEQNKLFFKITLLVLSFILLILFEGFENSFDKNTEIFFANVLGERNPDSNIVVIEITSSDLESIGPWPVKRSYYALLINTLSDYDVKSIGIEIFLSAKFTTQTLYDNLLVKEIEKSRNVVLSSVAGNINIKNDNYLTDSLSLPSPKLINENFKTGHLNYLQNRAVLIPLKINSYGLEEKAFSYSLFGKEIDEKDIPINFISSWEKIKRYSILDYFEMIRNKDEKLNSFKDKYIIIGITDPQIASSLKTYYDNEMPGSMLHAFALDNFLNNRYLNFNWMNVSKIILILIFLLLVFSERKFPIKPFFIFIILPLIFFIISFFLFSAANIIIAYSFFFIPLFFLGLADILFYNAERKHQLKGALNETAVLKSLFEKKENELKNLQQELDISGKADSEIIIAKIKSLKEDIERLKENEEDKKPVDINSYEEVKEFFGMVYKSKIMSSVVDMLKRTAPENANTLILGESGTGKELAAIAIHKLSKRCDKNFVAVNCAAIPDTLLESELFGHVKGAFTGAVSDKIGRFEEANNGTIFLDEIAETSENFQVKLLRIIQSGDFQKVGSAKTQHVDARIVAATNQNLEKAVKEKKFREDLYYRINVIKIELPPLRERKEDIEALTKYFIKKETENISVSKAVMEALINYSWKGNIRELEGVIKRGAIFAKTSGRNFVQLNDLPSEIIKDYKYNFEDLVIDSLRNKNFSHSAITEAAKELDVNRTLISENFRGISLKILVENNFDINNSAKIISNSNDDDTIAKVKIKLDTFLNNIEKDLANFQNNNFEKVKQKLNSKYKNLPQKFHIYLDQAIKNFLLKNNQQN